MRWLNGGGGVRCWGTAALIRPCCSEGKQMTATSVLYLFTAQAVPAPSDRPGLPLPPGIHLLRDFAGPAHQNHTFRKRTAVGRGGGTANPDLGAVRQLVKQLAEVFEHVTA